MAVNPVQFIRSRSREEWQTLFVERWTDSRIWIQENGEKAAVVALALGISLVLFYKIVLIIIALALAIGCAAWNVAVPEADRNTTDGKDTADRKDAGSVSPGEGNDPP